MTLGTQHNRCFPRSPPSSLALLHLPFFYDTGEGVTDGETECRDDEDVKCATFTHSLLYCLSLQERSEGVNGKQTSGYKDTGLPSLIHQPIGLDRIHQLPRIHRLPLFIFSLALPLSIHPLPPHLFSHCQSVFTLFCLSICPPPTPLPLLPSLLFFLSVMQTGDG